MRQVLFDGLVFVFPPFTLQSVDVTKLGTGKMVQVGDVTIPVGVNSCSASETVTLSTNVVSLASSAVLCVPGTSAPKTATIVAAATPSASALPTSDTNTVAAAVF